MSFEPKRAAGLPPLPKVSQMAKLVDNLNYSQADLYAQIIIRSLPEDPHANLIFAWVSKHFGLRKQYEESLKKALKSDRNLHDLAQDLHIDPSVFSEKTLANQAEVDELNSDGLHLIKAWGFGFGSEMAALMGQAYLAEILGRKPIIHWGENFLYRSEGNHCVFQDFFKPFNSLGIADTNNIEDEQIFPKKWKQGNLPSENNNKRNGASSKLSCLYYFNRKEKLTVADYYAGVVNIRPLLAQGHPLLEMDFDDTYRYLAAKYLRVRDDIIEKVDSFIQKNLSSGFIAVHARGSDKDEGYRALTSIPGKTLEYAKTRLATMPAETKLFLMTDDEKLLSVYKEEFGDRFVSTDSQRSTSEVGVHYDESNDKQSAGIEVLMDMLIAAQSECFIGMGLSNPSQLIYYFGDFDQEDYILFGENRLKQFNTHLYKTISVL